MVGFSPDVTWQNGHYPQMVTPFRPILLTPGYAVKYDQ
ncbi:hypothetical protein CGBL_0115690 [Corynebacterium glutamicum]|nr:hypothetical protein CGBL_0115690 [Corynebacterium glutamicum]